jgi:peptidylprolyl isomerase
MSKKNESGTSQMHKYKDVLSSFKKRYPKWRLFALGAIAVIAIVIGLAIGLQPSNEATTARDGDTVKVAYTGSYDNGSVFDSANSSAPLEFTVGNSSMIPGFEKGVIGMSVNETKTIRIAPEDGYGLAEYVADIGLFPSNVATGQYYSGSLASGLYIENARVTAVNDSTVTLENLHPLAGQYLNFEITLVELIKAGQASTKSSS